MRNLLILFLLLFLAFLIWVFLPPPTVLPDPQADWGDAPDPDPGMDTGYYEPVSQPANPLIFVYENAGVPALFPTDNVGDQGPYMIDVDDVWIGPMAVPPFVLFPGIGLVPPAAPAPGDIPSVELGPYDPADPDGVANLEAMPPSTVANKADCDQENSTHSPATQIGIFGYPCSPVPPYTIGMNGRLVIVVGNPPLALFLTRIWFGPAPVPEIVEGGVYWNLLMDTDQNGQWEGLGPTGEWVARDEVVPYLPPSTLVVSPVFEWGFSGQPFGRLLFPVWARSMVTTQRVADAVGGAPGDYHGEGPAGGFERGEVEDYFIEWRPIGQILAGAGGGGGTGDGDAPDATHDGRMKGLPRFDGPGDIGPGVHEYSITGIEVPGVGIVCVPGGSGAASGAADVRNGGETVVVCGEGTMQVSASLDGSQLTLAVESAPSGSSIVMLASNGEGDERGTGGSPVHGGMVVRLNP